MRRQVLTAHRWRRNLRRRRDLHDRRNRYDPLEVVHERIIFAPHKEELGRLVVLLVVDEGPVGLCELGVNGLVLLKSPTELSELTLGGGACILGAPEGALSFAPAPIDRTIAEVPSPSECRYAARDVVRPARDVVDLGSVILLRRSRGGLSPTSRSRSGRFTNASWTSACSITVTEAGAGGVAGCGAGAGEMGRGVVSRPRSHSYCSLCCWARFLARRALTRAFRSLTDC